MSENQRPGRRELSVDEYVEMVRSRDRAGLGRAITLVESSLRKHRELARELLARLLPDSGGSMRVGITGVPGVGKSTFIESLGMNLITAGHRVAVLAVDPTSQRSRGSIMGDKTRMTRLSNHPNAFVRPSPSGGSLGGVTRKTAETIPLCEAAGFDVVLVETVGVGQSETAVAEMVDFFLVLMLPGAGDELQGIKRGVMELADMVVVNKADGDNEQPAKRARRQYATALHMMRPRHPDWSPPVVCASGLHNQALDDVWDRVVAHRSLMSGNGVLQENRRNQRLTRIWRLVESELIDSVRNDAAVAAELPQLERAVADGTLHPSAAAMEILSLFGTPKS